MGLTLNFGITFACNFALNLGIACGFAVNCGVACSFAVKLGIARDFASKCDACIAFGCGICIAVLKCGVFLAMACVLIAACRAFVLFITLYLFYYFDLLF